MAFYTGRVSPASSPFSSLSALAHALASGGLSVDAVVERAIAAHQPELHAYRVFDAEGARRAVAPAQARLTRGAGRALTGVPVSIKDLYGVPGLGVHAGCPRPLPARFERPGPLVRALLEQGALVMGKTHTVQFAFGGLGWSPHFPTPLNPWDANEPRVAGGSSSGAGVSLCEGSAALALGTDTAGSVRIPAAMTGNAGLKVTAGRWSIDGIVPLSPTLDTPGLLARSVADLAWAFEALDGAGRERPDGERVARDVPLSSLRLAQPTEPCLWDDCSPGVVEAVEGALAELARQGAAVRRVAWPHAPLAQDAFRGASPLTLEFGTFLQRELPDYIATIDPGVAARIDFGGREAERLRRVEALRTLSEEARPLLSSFDAFVFPTVPITPPALADIADAERYRRCNGLSLRNTAVASFLGACALTVPVGLDARGLPVGLQLVGPAHGEARLLSVGLAIERQLGTLQARVGLPPGVAERPA